MSKTSSFAKWLLAGTMLTSLTVGLPAMAQDTPPDNAAPAEDVAPPADEGSEVVITGSRIKGKEYTSASPVTVITSEKTTAAGLISATEILQSSSVANGSGQVNSTFTGYVMDGGGGINTISLRGLGAQRSLVLLNGRRMPPAGVSGSVGAVDLNTIPDAVVNRYEILKDGASSIYGSDAVAGVVNVITRKNFEGLEFNATARVSEAGGGDVYNYSAIWGKSFDKGHFLVSASAYEMKALTQGDRRGLDCPEDYIFNADGSRADLVTTRSGETGFKCWGNLVGGIAIDGAFFRENRPGASTTIYGVPNPGWFGPVPFAERAMDPEMDNRVTVISPVKRYTVFAQGEYRPDWSNGAELYTELMFNRRESEQLGVRYIFPYHGPDSPTNPFGTSTPWGQATGGSYVYPYFLTKSDESQEIDVVRGVFGARGDLGAWSWDTYLSHSISDGTYLNDVVPQDRLFAGIGFDENEFKDVPICQNVPAGCIPLNLFTYDALHHGKLTDAEQNYFFVTEEGRTIYTQTIAEGTITGDLWNLPAGPLGAAFGVSVRYDRIKDTPGEYSLAGNSWGSASAGITKGKDLLSEAFFELEAPIVEGKPFFEDLKLNVSGRYSNYESVGSAFTYKVGANWAINNTFRLRATHGTSFRAPALYEMFLNAQTGFLGQNQIDPCINWGGTTEGGQPSKSQTIRDNCAADGIPDNYTAANASSALITYSGRLDLNPEESEATTFGFAFTPANTGFKMAVDWWRIEVNNQIQSTGAGVVGACYGQETFPNNGFCDLFERDRDPDSQEYLKITNVDASYRNIPSELTSGVDFTAAYEREFNVGTLSMDFNASFTQESKTLLFPGDTVIDYNGTIADPKWVGSLQTQFKHKDWTFTHTLNIVGESTNQGYREEDGIVSYSYAPLAYNPNSTKDWVTHDITVRYRAKDWTVVGGVINAFDEQAPILGAGDNTGAGTPGRLGIYAFSSQYTSGYLGRQYYLNFTKSF